VNPSFGRAATGGAAAGGEHGEPHEPPVVRDKRRVDPVTGLRRRDAEADTTDPGVGHTDPGSPAGGDAQVADLERQLRERTEDLQRLQAEYVNYKKRVDRDREAIREAAVGTVLARLLGVLDDIGRAREHDELVGGFRAVAELLERTVASLGLEAYGKEGEPFDPYLHEALTHTYSDDVSEPTCVHVMEVGYRIGDRILRPARVAVAEPSQRSTLDDIASADLGDQADGADDNEPEPTTSLDDDDDAAAGEDEATR
jgi:molecular chaperone GrpE